MKLPDYPIPGAPVKAAWGRQVVDYLRSITLRSGHGYGVNHGTGGTTLQVKPPAAAARVGGELDYAWRVKITGAAEVTITQGAAWVGGREYVPQFFSPFGVVMPVRSLDLQAGWLSGSGTIRVCLAVPLSSAPTQSTFVVRAWPELPAHDAAAMTVPVNGASAPALNLDKFEVVPLAMLAGTLREVEGGGQELLLLSAKPEQMGNPRITRAA